MAEGTDLPRFDSLTLAGDNAAEQLLAARAVHRAARDADDERHLLDVLGLVATPRITEHGMTGYRAGCKCRTCRKAGTDRAGRQTTPPTTTTADAPINTREVNP